MEPLSLSLAVIGVTQFVKLAAKQFAGFEVTGVATVVVAVLAAVVISFVDLNSELIQNVYAAAVSVGLLTGVSKIAEATRK